MFIYKKYENYPKNLKIFIKRYIFLKFNILYKFVKKYHFS